MRPMSNQKMRMERDFLGEKEVPAEAYYGIQTLRAVENFPITGYRIHQELIQAIAMVKKAAALANMEVSGSPPGLERRFLRSTGNNRWQMA